MSYMCVANCNGVCTKRVKRRRGPRDDGCKLGVREVAKDSKGSAPGVAKRLLVLRRKRAEQRVESHGSQRRKTMGQIGPRS